MATAVELSIDTTATAMQMAQTIFGPGITIDAATYTGAASASATYTGADTTSPGVAPADYGVILSTGQAADFTNSDGSTNTNQSAGRSTNQGTAGDADLTALAGTQTYDAAVLEVDFYPDGDLITLDFVLSSDEFPEYFASYNDTIGVWVNGTLATVNVGDGSASVANINGNLASNIYVDNTADQYNTEMDGFTVTLSFTAPVTQGILNTIKIAVGDGGDRNYDTNLLIAGGSVQSTIVAQDDNLYLLVSTNKDMAVLNNDSSTAPGSLTITHINGVPVNNPGDFVDLPTGQRITLNADGTLNVQADADGETINFTYSIIDSLGNVDSAVLSVTQMIACFTEGTRIMTPSGYRTVETLRPGDMVNTLDEGPQPVRWIGCKRVKCDVDNRPIRFGEGALGVERALRVSPNHRMFLSHAYAELLFSQPEVLVKAKDLINDTNIRVDHDCDEVTYYHILFDRHQIVCAEGAASEAYHPGDQTRDGFDVDVEAELMALFPDRVTGGTLSYGPTARLTLKTFEVRTLLPYLEPVSAGGKSLALTGDGAIARV